MDAGEELSTPIRYFGDRARRAAVHPVARHARPSPRRLFLLAERRSDLGAVLFKSRRAFVTIPELADEASPPPWGWTCAIQDRFRDLRCSVRDLLLAAALDLETGLPPYMRQNPAIMEPVLAQAARIRALLEVGCSGNPCDPDLRTPFHVVVHEQRSLRDGDGHSETCAPESHLVIGTTGRTWEVFGDPGSCPSGLPSRDLAGVAAFLLSGRCRSVVVLSGAGVSTASGIPSYRGDRGLWTTVRPDALSATPEQQARIARDPEWVASLELFRANPLPLLEVKRGFVLGLARRQWLPTAAHHVLALLSEQGLLTHVLTQNVDGLHQEAGVPADVVTEMHGTTRRASCMDCGRAVPLEEYAALLEANVKDVAGEDASAPAQSTAGGIPCPSCKCGRVRPETVLFGEEVNPAFEDVFRRDLPKADLLIVVGTSLLVAPAATAPMHTSSECVRLVVNDTRVGENVGLVFDPPESRRDIMVRGDIDAAFVELASALGWLPRLRARTGRMAAASAARIPSSSLSSELSIGQRLN